MTQEVLVLTATDLADEQSRALHGQFEQLLLTLVAQSLDRDRTPIVLRLDFPGEPLGGFQLRPRRVNWLGRLLWRCCGSPLALGI